jgi:hypothetical protein
MVVNAEANTQVWSVPKFVYLCIECILVEYKSRRELFSFSNADTQKTFMEDRSSVW